MNNSVNLERRKALKAIGGVATTSLILSTPALAAWQHNNYSSEAILECKLISRADMLRAHLLMHNRSGVDVEVASFESKIIRYDDSYLNLALAYAKPATIPANDRVMVRLELSKTFEPMSLDANVVDMQTEFLPLGTRVVAMKLIVEDGLAIVADYPVLT